MLSDIQLRHDVEAELDWDARLDSHRIGVAVKNGVAAFTGHVGSYLYVSVPSTGVKIYVRDGRVTLEGEVSTWHQKNAVEAALTSLRGLKGLSNNISIRSQVSMDDVQTRITEAFRRRAQLDKPGAG